jgi:hypothetical protein
VSKLEVLAYKQQIKATTFKSKARKYKEKLTISSKIKKSAGAYLCLQSPPEQIFDETEWVLEKAIFPLMLTLSYFSTVF